MKIKLSTLKRIIREEVQRSAGHLNEVYDECPCGMDRSMCDYHKPQEETKSTGPKEFSIGQRVKITFVDMYGFNGRDAHPNKNDVGRTGTIAGIVQDSRNHKDDWDIQDDEHYIVYDVRMDEGDNLDVVDFELEAI